MQDGCNKSSSAAYSQRGSANFKQPRSQAEATWLQHAHVGAPQTHPRCRCPPRQPWPAPSSPLPSGMPQPSAGWLARVVARVVAAAPRAGHAATAASGGGLSRGRAHPYDLRDRLPALGLACGGGGSAQVTSRRPFTSARPLACSCARAHDSCVTCACLPVTRVVPPPLHRSWQTREAVAHSVQRLADQLRQQLLGSTSIWGGVGSRQRT